MRRWAVVGLLCGFALAAGFAAGVRWQRIGRYQMLTAGSSGYVYRMDTRTGEAWVLEPRTDYGYVALVDVTGRSMTAAEWATEEKAKAEQEAAWKKFGPLCMDLKTRYEQWWQCVQEKAALERLHKTAAGTEAAPKPAAPKAQPAPADK